MDILLQLMSRVQAVGGDLVLWQRSTQMCSREAHEFMHALVFGWLVLLIFGVWLYRKINPPKKRVGAKASGDQIQLAPITNPL